MCGIHFLNAEFACLLRVLGRSTAGRDLEPMTEMLCDYRIPAEFSFERADVSSWNL
jgi:hypothetical protein